MSTTAWILFGIFVFTMLVLDLFVFHKKNHTVKAKEALWWTAFWIGLAFIFNAIIYFWKGSDAALQFLTGYLIEESLSVDNLFVFLMVFSYFKVPSQYQHKILFWGIFGALVMRAIFIFAGISLISKFHFTVFILGAFLIFGGIRMLTQKEKEFDPQKNFFVRIVRKFIPIVRTYHEDKFLVKIDGKYFATPLFLVLIIIEFTDLVFALDSIPAILAISQDSFIVYTSNIFAILGLRSLYFALAGIIELFHYIKYGLSIILIFVGVKLVIAEWYKIDIIFALLFVASVLAVSILASYIFPKKASALDNNL